MITHEFTGQSPAGYDDAIMLALYAAGEFLHNMHDAHVEIRALTQDGDQYHAVLEITKDPLAPAYTQDEFEEDQNLEHPNGEQNFKFFRRKGYTSLKVLIADHFAKKGQATPSGLPDFIIAHLTAVDIENNAIENDFLFAAEAMPARVEGDAHLTSQPDEKFTSPEKAPAAMEEAIPQT